MPPDASGDVKPTSGGLDAEALKKLIHDTINEVLPKAVHARVARTEESLAEVVKAELAKLVPANLQKPEPVAGEGDKPTLKALQEQIANLNKSLQDRDRKVQEADQRATQVRLRSEVQQQFAKHLGADSPHLGPYVNHYLSQFADKDGVTVRRVKDAYDIETLTPVEDAVAEMFKGDLKHLVNPSKAGNLPLVGQRSAMGQPIRQPVQQAPAGVNPLDVEMFKIIGEGRPELANELYGAAQAQAAAQNGTNGNSK